MNHIYMYVLHIDLSVVITYCTENPGENANCDI